MTQPSKQTILAINAGSSSVKFQLFARTPDLELLARGAVDNIGTAPTFWATDEKTQRTDKKTLTSRCTHESALKHILDWTGEDSGAWIVSAVAHRVVHGGVVFKQSALVTPAVIENIQELIPLDPLHQPHNLAAITLISKIHPGLPQIACFDTAFHFGRDPLFTAYALPKEIRDKGVRRYGFHGLSYEWIAYTLRQDAPQLARGRIIAMHLGNGASVCGMLDGVSVDTSMGMTAVEGVPMGTRCGTLDPGAVVYMIRNLALSADEAEHVFYAKSGLLGLSGISNDVHILQESDTAEARFALDYFSLRTAQFVGEMAVALGGMDGLVFTGGIGEHSSIVRDKVIARLAWMKPFEVRVIPANEERIMAMHAQACLET
jgi:acetate kinase